MNKILIQLAAIFFIALQPLPFLYSAQPQTHFASSPPQAKNALNALNKLPEFRDLLVKAQKEGPVHLRMEGHPQFEGLWDGNSRTIVVNTKFNPSPGAIICTILFELHNAVTATYFDQLIVQAQRGALTKDQYVEKVEQAEYKNARDTQALLDKGIEMGIFPESARWPIMPNFEDHYKVQQVSGHSLFIADTYDQINPRGHMSHYKGTIHRPSWMNDQDKDEFCRYIVMRSGLESPDSERAKRFQEDLKQEIELLKRGQANIGEKHHIERNPRRIALIKIAMAGNPHYQAEVKDIPYLAT